MTYNAYAYFAKHVSPQTQKCEACGGKGSLAASPEGSALSCTECGGTGEIWLERKPDRFVFIGGYISPQGYYVRYDFQGGYGNDAPPQIGKTMQAEFPNAIAALQWLNSWATVTS